MEISSGLRRTLLLAAALGVAALAPAGVSAETILGAMAKA